IGNQAPRAAFRLSSIDNLNISLDAGNSSDPDSGDSLSYHWNVGDGSAEQIGATLNWSYASAGAYTITLTVIDQDGASDSVSHDVRVFASSTPTPLVNPNDWDGDGHLNDVDALPHHPGEHLDSDGDGWGDGQDAYPTTPGFHANLTNIIPNGGAEETNGDGTPLHWATPPADKWGVRWGCERVTDITYNSASLAAFHLWSSDDVVSGTTRWGTPTPVDPQPIDFYDLTDRTQAATIAEILFEGTLRGDALVIDGNAHAELLYQKYDASSNVITRSVKLDANPATSGWQYLSTTFTPDSRFLAVTGASIGLTRGVNSQLWADNLTAYVRYHQDSDNDVTDDAFDRDDDNDGLIDGEDPMPYDPTPSSDGDGDGIDDRLDRDDDGDGIDDSADHFPHDPLRWRDNDGSKVMVTFADGGNDRSLIIDEAGAEQAFDIVLTAAPNADVTLPLALSDTSEGAFVGPDSLTFTADNWFISQRVVIRGRDDGEDDGNQTITLRLQPLTSSDAAFNGNNPANINLINRSLRITTSLGDVASGDEVVDRLNVTTSESGPITYSLIDAPTGMAIQAKTGYLTWTPAMDQVGRHHFTIVASNNHGGEDRHAIDITVSVGAADPNPATSIFVAPDGVDDENAGYGRSLSLPFKTLNYASNKTAPGDTVYVRGGTYHHDNYGSGTYDGGVLLYITTPGTADNWITYRPYGNEQVKLMHEHSGSIGIKADYIIVDGFEVEGPAAGLISYQQAVDDFWHRKHSETGISVRGPAQHVIVRNCIAHHCGHKGIGGSGCDHVVFEDNICYNNTWLTTSGGHGLSLSTMTSTDGDANATKVIIRRNLVFANEEHLFTILHNKPEYSFTVGLEGSGIHVQDNTNNGLGSHVGKVLIEDNLSLYNSKAGIHINTVENVTIRNNVSANNGQHQNTSGVSLQSATDAVVEDNLLHAIDGIHTIKELGSTTSTYDNNFVRTGATDLPATGTTEADELFVDQANHDYRPHADIATSGAGMNDDTLTHLWQKVEDYGIEVKPSGWEIDNVGQAQYLL
ncbi:MAG: PKD domain-containing protein, partial [Planctomycetota bacterium]